MVRTQIQFEKATYQKLRFRAKETGESISAIVRKSVERKMDDEKLDHNWSRVMNSMGKFDSGLTDLAEKHDQYLEDKW
ncbi:MAG: CopG family transcriptional regulator [Verrucomicrobia bacterium]|nr:CopG family transcriptional regulator [Verrucomicrobiota bacterium]